MLGVYVHYNSHEIIDKERETQSTFRNDITRLVQQVNRHACFHFTAMLSDEHCVLKANL